MHDPTGKAAVDLISIRMITDDVERALRFYERVTGVAAVRHTPAFGELTLGGCKLAVGHTSTVPLFGEGAAAPAANRSLIVELRVEDVDREYERLAPLVEDWVQAPTTMPWGNRSILFRDPDGTLVNLFTPVGAAALARF
jgi:catechol 2,3-dioxygenase-like lactoylglutathione lyase family enzyme